MGRRKINDCERGSEAPQVLYSPLSYGDNLHYEKFADGSVKCIEDEIPFELPDGWAWSRLGAVAEAIGDGDHQPPPQTSFGVPFLVISNVSGGRLSFENTRFVSKEYFSQLPETRKPRNGDLLFTVTGSYGIPVLIDSDDKFCFQRHIAIVRPCTISNRYLYVILGSSLESTAERRMICSFPDMWLRISEINYLSSVQLKCEIIWNFKIAFIFYIAPILRNV